MLVAMEHQNKTNFLSDMDSILVRMGSMGLLEPNIFIKKGASEASRPASETTEIVYLNML